MLRGEASVERGAVPRDASARDRSRYVVNSATKKRPNKSSAA